MTARRRLARIASTAATVAAVAFVIHQGVYHWQRRLVSGTITRTFEHRARARTYLLHPGSAASKKALVLILHGRGGSGRFIERRAHFDAGAERAGAVVAYPDAVDAIWNDGWWPNAAADDVAFLSALADALVAEFRIDPARVYAAGFSNGAGMVHRLACESDRFAAIAAIGGDMPSDLAQRCSNARPVSVLAIHGTDDRAVAYGAQLARTLQHWVASNACTGPTSRVLLPDADPGDGTRVRIDDHLSCRGGARVALYTIEGGGHTWPGEDADWLRRPGAVSRDIDASAVMLEFFLQHPRPAAP
jgi:polyhydroxybutyrate depolymerase